MKKLLVMMLVAATSVVMLIGCNANGSGEETSQNSEEGTVSSSEEGVSDKVSENEVSEEMTLEEKIAAEMLAKLEVGEDEIIVPETVTAEQIMARWEEIKVSDVEYAEDINKENLAGMLVLNCSYMEPTEYKSLVDEYFGSVDELMISYGNYISYLTSGNKVYGKGSSLAPEELLFDEYLINQSEQITYLVGLYQTDTENSETYYDILLNYLVYDQNKFFTFDCNDERLKGSGLAVLQETALRSLMDDIIEYDTDLYIGDNVFAAARTNIHDIVEEHYNQ